MEIWQKYKREYVYVILIFLLLELSELFRFTNGMRYMVIIGVLGVVLMLLWSVISYKVYSKKELASYNWLLFKLNLKRRFFAYFALPALFYAFLSLYLFYAVHTYMRQFIIVLGCVTIFTLFVHIRSSYSKNYSLSRGTKIVFEFVNIILFYLVISVVGFLAIGSVEKVLLGSLFSFIILMTSLILHDQINVKSFIYLFLAAIFIMGVMHWSIGVGVMFFALASTISYYFVISVWNLMLSGHRSLQDYLPPVLFSLMSVIIIFSI